MKIIVLAGGLSPERDVSLTSGAGICKTLREKGHQAFLLDVFFGLPYDTDKLDEVFDLPGGGLEIAEGIKTTVPDLEALKNSVLISLTASSDQTSLNFVKWQTSHLWGSTVLSEKMENCRQCLTSSIFITPVRTPLAAHYR